MTNAEKLARALEFLGKRYCLKIPVQKFAPKKYEPS